jgi:hypothetical protein
MPNLPLKPTYRIYPAAHEDWKALSLSLPKPVLSRSHCEFRIVPIQPFEELQKTHPDLFRRIVDLEIKFVRRYPRLISFESADASSPEEPNPL